MCVFAKTVDDVPAEVGVVVVVVVVVVVDVDVEVLVELDLDVKVLVEVGVEALVEVGAHPMCPAREEQEAEEDHRATPQEART